METWESLSTRWRREGLQTSKNCISNCLPKNNFSLYNSFYTENVISLYRYRDSRLKPGDELLMVDGRSLVGLTHAEAVEVLKSTQRLVQLVVATEDDGESIASSVQSIPELMSGHRRKSRTAQEIAPEIINSPNRSAFEMAVLRTEESDPQVCNHVLVLGQNTGLASIRSLF